MSRKFKAMKTPAQVEQEILEFWKAEGIFERQLAESEGRPEFVFYEGPPTANGTPHNGHVLTRVIKDLFPRYKSMRGYHVHRKAGWDTHGLPVEVEVEKTLGIHGKEAIEAYGLEPFAAKCIDSVFKYTSEWEELTDQLGFWVDTKAAYVTYHRDYVESVWWALSELFKKGLLYQGHKVIWWWPQGGTALSSAEVGLGYKEVDDPSVTVRFPVAGEEGVFLLAWTTTPWTLPSNTAITVHPKLDYSYVRREIEGGSEVVVMASTLVEKLAAVEGDPGAEIVKTVKGSELVGLRYEPVYRFAEPEGGDAWKIIAGDFVTADTGSGLVHTAPAFGEDDYAVAKKNGVGMLQLVAPNGKFVEGTGFLEGRFCKDTDKDIIRDLKERGLLFKRETYRHDYPFCWRADDDPLIQYARPAWFIKTTALNAEALANNAAVNWSPEHIKEGRFGDFLRNNVDWALSRERFWGTPLNIWRCADEGCEHMHVPSSTAEIVALNEAAGLPDPFDASVDRDLQIHRPWIDKVTLPCAKCGSTMNRVPEVIDCWFDSGAMPFAQWGFPHKGREEFSRYFPADFISEAIDQTRGWFYSLLMISTLLFDDEACQRYGLEPVGVPRPYKNCIVLGHVCDMDGKKESKSKGNYTSPNLVIRGQMTVNLLPDDSLKPGEVGFKQAQLKSLGFGSKDRFTALSEAGNLALKPVPSGVEPKDTVHMHPDDIAQLGLGDTVTLKAPFEAPGADAFRWLFYASNPPSSNTRLSMRSIRELQREFLIRLKNVHTFFTIYANISGFDPGNSSAARPVAERDPLDRWILSELNALTAKVTQEMDAYHLYEAATAIQEFVGGLANWYVRRSRRRFWGEGQATDDALWTLYEVLTSFSRLIAPFVPFTAEALHRDLVASRTQSAAVSVHLDRFPEADEALVDATLAEDMTLLRELARLGRDARERIGVRVRQPLAALEVVLADPSRAERLKPLLSLLQEELNVRTIHFTEDADRFVAFQVKPNFKALGRRLGKEMKLCAAALGKMSGAEARRAVLSGGLTIALPSGEVTLTEDDVMVAVRPKEGFEAAGSASAVVALSGELNDDLRQEGLMREIVSKVQSLRKQLDLAYTDRIHLGVGGDAAVSAAVERFRDYVAQETLVAEWLPAPESAEGVEAIEIDGSAAWVLVTRAG